MARIHNILDFTRKKQAQEKISVVTCYDYTSAILTAKSDIDCVLVGDSLSMTMHGLPSTVHTVIEDVARHTQWVIRGLNHAEKRIFVIADMPFLTSRGDLQTSINNAKTLLQAGADAIKIEGAKGNLELIKHLTQSGVPVMGHLGLMPQQVNILGGYKVQGKTEAQFRDILEDAKALEAAGCFALVLECVPSALGAEVSKTLSIPTIGIGAGNDTDGQVLVWQDLLGLNTEFKPKFVRKFTDGAGVFIDALNQYDKAVKSKAFPNQDESF